MMRSTLLFLSIAVQALTAVASGGHHQQHKHARLHHRQALDTSASVVGSASATTSGSIVQTGATNANVSDAADKVERALAVLAVI